MASTVTDLVVTGAAGFIGSTLSGSLVAAGLAAQVAWQRAHRPVPAR